MKTTKFLSIIFAVLLFCGSSCNGNRPEEKEYPITLGEQTLVGKIIVKGNPCPPSDFPCLPFAVLWLETTSDNYVISIDSYWIREEKIIVEDIEYLVDDEVEVIGEVKVWQNQFYEEYFSIEIETIKKLP